jgi:hypothetical protein
MVVDIAARKRTRAAVMNAIFDAADGSELDFVDPHPIGAELGLSDQEMGDACKYLEGQWLIENRASMGRATPFAVKLRHQGIVEIEAARENPEEPTANFPPLIQVIQNFHGDVTDSPMQIASPGGNQTTFSEADPS